MIRGAARRALLLRGGVQASGALSQLPRATFTSHPRMPALEHLKFKMDDSIEGLGVITLNRPERRDAVSPDMAESMVLLCSYLNQLPAGEMRCVLLQSSTDQAFSAGRDLKISAQLKTEEEKKAYLLHCVDSAAALNRLHMPTVACVTGAAYGWGVEAALACDLRVAYDQATFCLPECGLAIFPGAGGAVWLPRIAGPAVAKELIYTSRKFSGKEAKALGVVNHSEPSPDAARAKARELCTQICENGPLGVRGAKSVIEEQFDLSLAAALGMSLERRLPLNHTHDFTAAVEAFKHRGKPEFEGR